LKIEFIRLINNSITITEANKISLDNQGIQNLCDLINQTYKVGEEHLWIEGVERITLPELSDKIIQGNIFIAQQNKTSVGLIEVKSIKKDDIAEFGMLSVDLNHKKKGIGGLLVSHAENWAKKNNFKRMQLELLTPINFKHLAKEHLKKWYSHLGYVQKKSEKAEISRPAFNGLLACECLLSLWLKDL